MIRMNKRIWLLEQQGEYILILGNGNMYVSTEDPYNENPCRFQFQTSLIEKYQEHFKISKVEMPKNFIYNQIESYIDSVNATEITTFEKIPFQITKQIDKLLSEMNNNYSEYKLNKL